MNGYLVYIQKCEEKAHKSIRTKAVSGKRSVYCVAFRDSCRSKWQRDGFVVLCEAHTPATDALRVKAGSQYDANLASRCVALCRLS